MTREIDNAAEMENAHPLSRLFHYGKKGNPPEQLKIARGAAYEIEKAYDLIQQGEQVLQFGIDNKGTSSIATFDFETNKKYIECKNINWSTIINKNSIKILLKRHAQMAKEYGKIFELHSKQTVPELWKNWFDKNNIVIIED